MKPKTAGSLAIIVALGILISATALFGQGTKPADAPPLQYSHSHWFPEMWDPYTSPHVPANRMSNSDRVHELVRDGKLHLTVDDAIALALENNLDIAVSRFTIGYSQTDLLRAQGGGATRGFAIPLHPTSPATRAQPGHGSDPGSTAASSHFRAP